MNAPQWTTIELSFTARTDTPDPYPGVDLEVRFIHQSGLVLRRPGFWDGGPRWKVRFASPLSEGRWSWESRCLPALPGLHGEFGHLQATPSKGQGRFEKHGLLRMSPQGRSVEHADGSPFLVVADTAWALPWRATEEGCREYARTRQAQGFNACLMMTVQPDMRAVGPRSRTEDEGFMVGFDDLPDGHLNRLVPTYFQEYDRLIEILLEHEIVPVHQPVFHGYGWKGLQVAGPVVPPEEYARYCRYLVARYGSYPAFYLVGADGDGMAPGICPGGAAIEAHDAYQQPTGIHYQPHARNRAWQSEPWLDFQWCQTGHNGWHLPERVMDMWRNCPAKGVANGEPTYENIGHTGKASGWWQGHEAWSNLCAGGTMGVVYGAGSLWQWKLHPDEPGHAEWCSAPGCGWREALRFPGAGHVGAMQRILQGLPLAGLFPDWTSTHGIPALSLPGKLLILYLPDGGGFTLLDPEAPRAYRVFDPRDGKILSQSTVQRTHEYIRLQPDVPLVVVFHDS